jgi:uncharacterized protein
MDCTYCFYLEKEQLFAPLPTQDVPLRIMSEPILETYIQKKLNTESSSEQSFIWQGGEPTLLGLEYFEKVVALQQKHARGKGIQNAVQTNGVLLNDEWCEFFAKHNFLVGISIDGPRELNDKYRVNKAGDSTFDKVVEGVALLKKHQVEFNTLTTVHKGNADHALEIYRFLKELGSRFMQFIPIVEKNNDMSVDSKQYGDFLVAIFDEWVSQNVGHIFVQNFDVALEAWSGLPSSLCVFAETCGTAPVLEHNGDMYACDHYVEPKYKIGNILDDELPTIMQSPQQVAFGQDKLDQLHPKCIRCDYRFACHGGCPKDRILTTTESDNKLNYLCDGYTRFFEHIDPQMKFMANEIRHRRAPANVMITQ